MKYNQKEMFEIKTNNYNTSLKKKNVYNRLYSDSIKKKRILNDLQIKHLAAEAQKYPFIPKINHNYKKIVKNDINNNIYKTSFAKNNLLRLKNIQNEINNAYNTYMYKGNITDYNKNKSINNNYQDNVIWNNISDNGSFHKKEKSVESNNIKNIRIIYNLKNKLFMSKKNDKNVGNSATNKNKNNIDFSKIILSNAINPFNININDNLNNMIDIKKKYENKNFNLYTDQNNYKLKEYDDNNNKNIIYKLFDIPNPKIIKNNKNNKTKHKYSCHSLSINGLYTTDNRIDKININNKMRVNNYKFKKNEKMNNNYNTKKITKNGTDCFSYLFNSFLSHKKKFLFEKKKVLI